MGRELQSVWRVKVRAKFPEDRQRLLDYGMGLNNFECEDGEVVIMYPNRDGIEQAVRALKLEQLDEIREAEAK